jgi:general L-amino acid transport system permease protein
VIAGPVLYLGCSRANRRATDLTTPGENGMTTMDTEPPKAAFRASDLIYDTRYRSLTIQVIAMILILTLVVFLVNNVRLNLAALGRPIDFGFLGEPAGYDIGQTLIPYASTDTHARAALVGILNTLLVAFLGCILATVLGVVIGVARLSKNWIIARLMTVYVEIFRNVPLLFWIYAVFFGVFVQMPEPRDYREGGAASMLFGQSVAFTNRGVYAPGPVWGPGSLVLVAVVILSIIAAVWWRRRARRVLFDTGRQVPVVWPVLAMLILPGLAAYFALGRPVTLEYPSIARFNFEGGIAISNALLALWLALSLYTAAFIAEIVRAGILAISKGQTEASSALGLRPNRTMSLVVLPQALRVIIPPLISQYLNLTKNSSLAIATGYMDVRNTLGGITINQTGKELEGMLLVGIFYLIVSLLISAGLNVVNSRVKLKER